MCANVLFGAATWYMWRMLGDSAHDTCKISMCMSCHWRGGQFPTSGYKAAIQCLGRSSLFKNWCLHYKQTDHFAYVAFF